MTCNSGFAQQALSKTLTALQAGDETKVVGLYLVPGVDEQYAFCSQTQGEVFQFAWFRIQDLMNQMKRGQQILVGPQAAKFVHVWLSFLQWPSMPTLQQAGCCATLSYCEILQACDMYRMVS